VDVAISFDINHVTVRAMSNPTTSGGAAAGLDDTQQQQPQGLVMRTWPWAHIVDWDTQDEIPCVSGTCRVAVLVTVSGVGSFVFSVEKEHAALMQAFERRVAAPRAPHGNDQEAATCPRVEAVSQAIHGYPNSEQDLRIASRSGPPTPSRNEGGSFFI
jgi:hypothetical protein